MKKREGDPWMSPPVYGRSLRGLGVNMLVRETARAAAFARDVLGLTVVYVDADLAVLRHGEHEWMAHADHTYDAHALLPRTQGRRAARAAASSCACTTWIRTSPARPRCKHGYEVLEPPSDKPHGLREAYILDADGYVWVPDTPSLSKWAV